VRRQRNAKIIATLGPASSTAEQIRQLVVAGADVFRLNFSHGSHEDHRQRLDTIRALEAEIGRPIGIMADLQGPKLRVGKLKDGAVQLTPGAPFRLDLSEELGDERRAPLPHPEVLAALKPGTDVLLDDGRLRLRVSEVGSDYAETEVVLGGKLSNHKGVNLPGATLSISPLTAKDRRDLAFALEIGVDWVAQSFVQRPEDVDELRGLCGNHNVGVLSKLEKPSAIEHLERIVELTDAVMVARGDLGVELPPEQVPAVQKRIVRACRRAGKPVVVATQMLESMVTAPTPTRAEASDVATAIYDGVDAVMLSAESAAGQYPTEAVAIMDRIITQTERDPLYRELIEAWHPAPSADAADTICHAMSRATQILSVAAAVTYTESGSTCLRAARERPRVPILGLTPLQSTARRLALVWGVHSVSGEEATRVQEMVDTACRVAVSEGLASSGDTLVIAAGMPFKEPGSTNLLRIATIP
jgi:pyruvate kinase